MTRPEISCVLVLTLAGGVDDGDLLGRGGDGELEIELGGLADGEADAGAALGREAVGEDLDGVGADGDGGRGVAAGGVGGEAALGAGVVVVDADGGMGGARRRWGR